MQSSDIFFSVIICSYKRADYLSYLLRSLTHQTWKGGGWEVIVVENDFKPSVEIYALLRDYEKRLPLKSLFIKFPNLSHARNTGADFSQAKYVAYLDDDAEVTPLWLEALMQQCMKYEPDFCGGPIFGLFRTERPYWFREIYGTSYFYGCSPRFLNCNEMIGGGNFVLRRDLIKKLGGFHEDLGMAGKKFGAGEETDLLKRAWNAFPNLKVQYLPEAAVLHTIRPEKMTLRWQLKSYCDRAETDIRMKNLKISRLKVCKDLFPIIISLMKRIPRLFIVICSDILHPNRTLWQRYIKENMLHNIAKIHISFLLMLLSKKQIYNKYRI